MPKAIILMYHNIEVPPQGTKIPNLYVTPRMFRFQMWYLMKSGFKVVSLQDLLTSVTTGRSGGNLAALTFDDGYLDFYKNAYAVLHQYRYPATVFVVSRLVGGNNEWDAKKEPIAKPLMNWEQIIEISGKGIEIGSHTRTHPELSRISSDEQAMEIAGSKQDLEQRLHKEVRSFCYPGGDTNSQVREQVQAAGYQCSVSTQRGHVEPGFDPFMLRRIPIKLITNPASFLYKVHTHSEKRKGRQW